MEKVVGLLSYDNYFSVVSSAVDFHHVELVRAMGYIKRHHQLLKYSRNDFFRINKKTLLKLSKFLIPNDYMYAYYLMDAAILNNDCNTLGYNLSVIKKKDGEQSIYISDVVFNEAIRCNNIDIVKYILKANMIENKFLHDGIRQAILYNRDEILSCLLETDIQFSNMSSEMRRRIDSAIEISNLKIIKILMKHCPFPENLTNSLILKNETELLKNKLKLSKLMKDVKDGETIIKIIKK